MSDTMLSETMTTKDFAIYTTRFEKEVLLAGYKQGMWGTWKDVTIRPGKLAKEPIGQLVGTRFVYSEPAAIEYHGHIKKSTAFMEKAVELQGVRTLFVPQISVCKPELVDIERLAPDLLVNYAAWWRIITKARWDENGTDPELGSE